MGAEGMRPLRGSMGFRIVYKILRSDKRERDKSADV
jgi:hypothetical protein